MKRLLPLVTILLLVAAFSAFFKVPGNLRIPKNMRPTAKIVRFDIHSISLKDVTFLFDVSIKNPYPLPLKLDHVKLQYDIEGKKFLTTRTRKGFSIPARRSKVNRFLVTLSYNGIMRLVNNYNNRDYLKTKTHITIAIPLPRAPGLPRNITFRFARNQKIPAIHPQVNVTGFHVEQPSTKEINRALKKARKKANPAAVSKMFRDVLAGKKPRSGINPNDLDVKMKVRFNIVLENKTRAALAFNSLNFKFYINGKPLMDGKTGTIRKQGNRYILPVNNTFSSKALAGSIINAFRSKKGTFAIKGATTIRLPASVTRHPVTLNFDEKGNFRL